MSWTEFRSALLAVATDEIWSQWSALGVGSTSGERSTRVDLEALLLGTMTFGRTDPRLFDEALSWCCRFGDFVNHKRLEKLIDERSESTTRQLARAWGDTVAEHSGVDWRFKPQKSDPTRDTDVVFLTDELHPQTTGSKHDAVFAKHSLLRGPFTPRDTARRPALSAPALTQLFARKFIGGGCRAEVLTLLLHGHEATTSQLAQMSVYSRRLVQNVLADLLDAGMLDWDPGRGRTTHPVLLPDVRDGLRSVATRRAPGELSGSYALRDDPGFFLGLQVLWQAAVTIEQSELHGFKAQSVLGDALSVAVAYHRRNSVTAIYRPRLEAGSYEVLLGEGLTYLSSLNPAQNA
jgi:hypothetical protein